MEGIWRLPRWKVASSIVIALLVLGTGLQSWEQVPSSSYPAMAPVDQYRMARDSEIELARSAAPESISRDAEILSLGQRGFETAIKGKNGFVCMVQRSWSDEIGDPEFWNPKQRGPICFNAAAARSYLPHTIKKTEWALAGLTKAQISEKIRAALDNKELISPEPGAMCYMMSKHGYLNDRDGHWHPHLMFFVPATDPEAWGAGLPGSPLFADKDTFERVTVFMVPVEKWSDGTPGPPM